jgi:hypothetical protein
MAVDGVYNITVNTPMGSQVSKLTLITSGNTLTGTNESQMMGTSKLTGTVNGNEVQWEENASTPMGDIKISFKGKVEGDKISGEATTPFGSIPLEGTKA